AKGVPLDEVLDSVILAVEKQATMELRASIQLLDDEAKQFRLCAAPSLPESYRQMVARCHVDVHDTPCALALFKRGPVIVSDLANAPEWANVVEMLAPYGIRSIWSSPIISSDQKPLGTLCLYSAMARMPGEAEQAMIKNVTHTLALAIERRQAETEREEL